MVWPYPQRLLCRVGQELNRLSAPDYSTPAQARVGACIRPVIILAYPGCFVGDVIKLLETIYSLSARPSKKSGGAVNYVVQVYSMEGGTLVSPSTALIKVETQAVSACTPTDIDMLIIAHGPQDSVSILPRSMLDWLQGICPQARRVVALGAGVFWLAAAGLLGKRRVTTHSALVSALCERYPAVQVAAGVGLQVDGHFYTTSERINASDMVSLLLREDQGERIFETLGSHLVRTPAPSQCLIDLRAALARRDSITYRICIWWLGHLDQDLSMERSAMSLCMSERNFRRHFKIEVGCPPYYFLLLLRLDMARQALIDSNLPVDKIARRGGLLDGQQLARMFRKYIGVSPQQYRANMRAGAKPESHPDYAQLFNAESHPQWLQHLLADVVLHVQH